MNLGFPRLSGRLRHVCVATMTAVLLAVVRLHGQYGAFNQSFDGELWGVRYELFAGGGAAPSGVAYVDEILFVADSNNQTVTAYDGTGQIVPKLDAQWNAADPDSPVHGLVPHQLAAVVVNVDGTDRNAILISDQTSNHVAAFDTDGAHLFTLRLDPTLTQDTLLQSTGMVAMSAGAKFNLTDSGQTLTLSGTFAAGRVEQETTGPVKSGALVFQGSTTPIPLAGAEFIATATTVLRGTETDPAAPAAINVFGVAFDTVGNLYILDSFTERLHVYGLDLSHLFTFGTPVPDGTSAEFFEPWGMAFWPDAAGTGGRLFINDTYNSRILIYRPVDGPDGVVDGLQLESVINNFVAPDPAIALFSLAIDQSSGAIAVTDFETARVVVLQQARLATFDFQVLDQNDNVVASVCTGTQYKVRFSLTVPAGLAAVTGVSPQLAIDGVPTSAPAVPSPDSLPSSLSGGQVVTYTYTLTAPDEADGDIQVMAGATATNTTDILMRSEAIALGDCAGETDPSTITATPSALPQVSGWTPVFEGETFRVTLVAQDVDGIESIEYQLAGANDTGDVPVSETFDGVQSNAVVVASIPGFGRTTLRYRVRDSNQIWSAWQPRDINSRPVVNRSTSEDASEVFRLGEPEVAGVTYSVSVLPEGATFSTATGQFGGMISFAAHDQYSANPAIATGQYRVVVTETLPGGAASSVSFTWTINNINRPPDIDAAGDQRGWEGEAVSLQVVASDPDGDALGDWNVTGLPPGLSLSHTGVIEGTLSDGSAGVYYPVNVSVRDGTQPSVTTFKWTVTEWNRAPVANSDSYAIAEDTPLIRAVPGVLSNDTDAEMKPLTAILEAGPSHGTLALNANGSFVYVPAANFNGTDAFTYKASDGSMDSAAATVAITVTAINDQPSANPDAASVLQGQSVSIAVRANDTDPDVPTTLTIVGVTTPTSGHAVINTSDGTVTYTAAPTFVGTATFSYTIRDGSLTATALVTITVLTGNVPPVCGGATGGEIFPPNHKFYLAPIIGVFDPDGNAVTITVTGIWQDELIDSTGDGKFAPDGRIENGQAWVRAERNGHGNKAAGNGRVYEILFTAVDAKGGSCTGSVFYTVPHDKGQRSTAIDSGVRYDSTGVIPGARDKTQIHKKSPLP